MDGGLLPFEIFVLNPEVKKIWYLDKTNMSNGTKSKLHINYFVGINISCLSFLMGVITTKLQN